MDKKICVITGAAGFLGVHLCHKFLNAGYVVFGVDDFSTSSKTSNQFIELLKFPFFHFSEFDVRNAGKWDSLLQKIDDVKSILDLRGKDVDLVLNFACPASPPQYMKMPVKTLLTSVVGTHNALELARKTGATFVQASTSEVYGDALEHPQKESYWGNVNSYGCRSNYDVGKRAGEALCYDYKNSLGVDARVVRIFNTYGPGMLPSDGRVITTLLTQAIKREPLTVFGDGTQTRSFCYVDDLVEVIQRVTLLDKNSLMSPVNIGNDKEFTLNQLISVVQSIVPVKQIIYTQLPKDDPKQRQPDLTLVKHLTGWEPKVQLREGINKTFEWLKTVV